MSSAATESLLNADLSFIPFHWARYSIPVKQIMLDLNEMITLYSLYFEERILTLSLLNSEDYCQ